MVEYNIPKDKADKAADKIMSISWAGIAEGVTFWSVLYQRLFDIATGETEFERDILQEWVYQMEKDGK